MNLEQARDAFAVRYYLWALDDWRREIAEDFRLLKSVKGAASSLTTAAMEELPLETQLETSVALTKHYHKRAVEILGQPLTPREQELCAGMRRALLGALPEEEGAGRDKTSPGDGRAPRPNRTLIGKLLAARLTEALVAQPEKRGQTLRFRRQVEGWEFVTDVSRGSPPSYWHNLWANEGAWLEGSISLLSWLGIGRTIWDLAREGDEASVATSMASLCVHLASAAPTLLSGISHDVSASEPSSHPVPHEDLRPRLVRRDDK